MADIRKNLVLVDKFTSVFDRFIAKTEKSENTFNALADQMLDIAEATESIDETAGQVLPEIENGMTEIESQATETAESILDLADSMEDLGDRGEQAFFTMGKAARGSFGILDKLKAVGRALLSGFSQLTEYFIYAPDEIAQPWNDLQQNVFNTTARVAVSMLAGMQRGVERLNQAFSSPAGQRLIKVLQVGFEGVGMIVGFVAERVADFINFLGDQVTNTGTTFADLFEFLGGLFGAAYVTAHNIIATLYNAIASFAEFIANVFNNPMDAVMSLFQGAFNFIMDTLMTITRALDKIFRTDWTTTLAGWRNKVNDLYSQQYSQDKITFDRMDIIGYDDIMNQFSAAGRNLGERLSAANIDMEQLRAIKNIEESTYGILDAVTDEDLQMLIDMATRRFISQVNLTAQTPVITINGANTGNTEADRNALAKAIRDILIEQLASNSTTGYYAYQGA